MSPLSVLKTFDTDPIGSVRRLARPLLLLLLACAAFGFSVPGSAAAPPAPAPAMGQAAPAFGVDQLMSTLAQRKSGRVRFTETKYLAMLAKPVQSSGELVFTAPDHLEKRTVSPKAESMVLDGDASKYNGVGITLEPAGGSPEPTSDPIALFEFS